MSNIIRTEHLSLTYGIKTPFEKNAVEDLNIEIKKGEFLGIIGHTGSGKSTLVQMLNGLIAPTSGKVYLNDVDINADKKKLRQVRFQVGMVFQYPEYQLFEDIVYKDIAFGPSNMGINGDELNERVLQSAGFVGLKKDLLLKSPFDLSGGEKRRAAIAGVIAMDPEVLILDEPTAGLDPQGRDRLLNQIVKYHNERKNTVILVSHSMEDIARVADRILVMNKGKCEMLDTTKAVFAMGEKLEKMGLQIPQITKITQKLRSRGVALPSDILTVDEAYREIIALLKREGKIK
jgi:energy-coupling factor transport system ATP-binding protein